MMRDSRRDDRGRRRAGQKARPQVEGLEGRQLLYAAVGAAWPHPNLITYSIVPDGTSIGGDPSTLVSSFDGRWSRQTWVNTIEEAAAIWEQVANINLVPVYDDGVAMGVGSYQQGDPGMGDIRISGLPSSQLGSGTLGYTLYPPPLNGGSESGDIVFNTTLLGAGSNTDLLTVAIHEFGHALGLGESMVDQAVMLGYYTTIKQSLAPDDIAGIQSIYGARQPDAFMSTYHNSTSTTAADATPFLNSAGQFLDGVLDLQTSTQVEWWKVTVPSSTSGQMLIVMQAGNLSLLSPGIDVYTAMGQYLGSAGTNDAPGNTISFQVNGVLPGQTYYFATYGDGDGNGWCADGGYGLEINFNPTKYPLPLFASPNTATLVQPSKGGSGSYDVTATGGTAPDPAWLARIESGPPLGVGNPGQGGDHGHGRGGRSQGPAKGPSTVYWVVPPPQASPVVTVDLGSATPDGSW
jgi:hypothetical protein